MATEPQSTSQAPVNTSLRKTSVWNVYLHQNMGAREKKQLEPKHMAMPLKTSLEPPPPPPSIPGNTAALAWF